MGDKAHHGRNGHPRRNQIFQLLLSLLACLSGNYGAHGMKLTALICFVHIICTKWVLIDAFDQR